MTDTQQQDQPGLRDLLKIRNFRFLWLGQIVSDFGDNLTYLSLLLLVNRLTGSTVALAGLAIALAVPSLVFGLISGVYVDRLDRRMVMIVSDALRGTLVLAFLFVRSADLIWLIYVIAFAQATVGTLFTPAKSALLPRLVPKESLLAANSISQTSKIIFNLAGTATAGIIVGIADAVWPAFIIDSATFFVSMVLVSRIRTEKAETPPEMPNAREVWTDLRFGFVQMLSSRPLTGVLLTGAVAMLGLGAVNILIVPLIVEDLMISETFFAVLEASQVGGMIVAGIVVAVLAAKFKPTVLISTSMAGIGVVIAFMSQVGNWWHMAAVLFVVGLLITPLQASVSTLTQTLIADEMRGRVGGALNALISAATVLSMAFAGVVAAAIGVRNVFIVAGLITVGAAIIGVLLFRGQSLESAEQEAAPTAS